jgi:hypothetical protein
VIVTAAVLHVEAGVLVDGEVGARVQPMQIPVKLSDPDSIEVAVQQVKTQLAQAQAQVDAGNEE